MIHRHNVYVISSYCEVWSRQGASAIHVRDLEVEIMRDVCVDVKVEPELLSLHNLEFIRNNAEKARLDVSGICV